MCFSVITILTIFKALRTLQGILVYTLVLIITPSNIFAQKVESITTDSDLKAQYTHLLARFQRPFTFMYLGDDHKTMLELANAYPRSSFVLYHKCLSPENKKEMSKLNNVIWLSSDPIPTDVAILSRCEHVDVLIVDSHFIASHGHCWQSLLPFFRNMTMIFVITIYSDLGHVSQTKEMLEYCSRENWMENVKGKGYEMLIHGSFDSTFLIQTSFIHPKKSHRQYRIDCNYQEKNMTKICSTSSESCSWLPGINLMTYICLQGAYPSWNRVYARLPHDHNHRDWMPNNMVIQGKKIILIDHNDPESSPFPINYNYYKCLIYQFMSEAQKCTSSEERKELFINLFKAFNLK